METAQQPAGELATNLNPTPITDRQQTVYHKRRPNAVVRGLYACFRWLGDFGPMFAELFRFIGRSILVTVNMVILVGIIIISFSHSLELLRYAGLHSGLEWVGVVVWELAFIFSSMVLSRDFKQGNWRSGWAPWTGFLMGLAFVMVSNYTGMADNPTGRILGVATPLLLLVFKGVLAHQVKRRETPTREEIREVETGRMEWETRETPPAPAEVEAAATREKEVEDSPAADSSQEAPGRVGDTSPALRVATRENREEQRVESRETSSTLATVADPEPSPATPAAVVKSPTPAMEENREKMETGREEETAPAPATQPGDTTREDDREEVVATREGETDRKKNREREGKTSPAQVEGDREGKESSPTSPASSPGEVERVAMEIREREGVLPGRRRLSGETGCSDWTARKVLKELRAKKTG